MNLLKKVKKIFGHHELDLPVLYVSTHSVRPKNEGSFRRYVVIYGNNTKHTHHNSAKSAMEVVGVSKGTFFKYLIDSHEFAKLVQTGRLNELKKDVKNRFFVKFDDLHEYNLFVVENADRFSKKSGK